MMNNKAKDIVTQQENSWTHIRWTLDGVTPDMLDWHWCNIDKSFLLWHPQDHRGIGWAVRPTADKFIGAVHKTIQGGEPADMWDYNQVPFGLKYWDPQIMTKEMADVVFCDHMVLVGSVDDGHYDAETAGSFRIFQWSSSDNGVVGMTTAITPQPKDLEAEKESLIKWTEHARGEIHSWEDYLPTLYRLYEKVDNPQVNIRHSLKIEKTADGLVRYVKQI